MSDGQGDAAVIGRESVRGVEQSDTDALRWRLVSSAWFGRFRSPWILAAGLAVVVAAACAPLPPPPAPRSSTPKVFLTFDDGPSVFTPQILSVLQSKGVRATFFIVGEHATQYPSYVQQESANGMVVGDHTWDHPDLTTLPPEQVRWELESTADEIETLTGKRPTLWRAPYSLWNATVNEVALSLGLTRVGADVNSRDYSEPGTDAVVSAVTAEDHR